MPTYAYSAVGTNGAEEHGEVVAAELDAAIAQLRARNLYPTEVTPATARATPSKSQTPPRRFLAGRIPARSLTAFIRQLATLLRAGIPLHRALVVLGKQERHTQLRFVIHDLAEGVEAGRALSRSLELHPRVFDHLQVSLVRAGETAGALELVLERLAGFQEKRIQIHQKLRAAMIYPAAVLTVAVGILTALLTFVVPKFAQVFADLLKGAPLPALTRAVLAISHGVRDHVGLLGLIILFCFVAIGLLRRTFRGRSLLDHAILRVPLIGALTRKSILVRFNRTLGTLLGSGVPVLQALAIARDTCGNRRVSEAVTAIHDAVEAGSPLARPLEASGEFPPLVSSMVEVGEQSGQLPEMLAKAAEIQEGELDAAVAGLSALLEPLLIVFLAVVVGTIVIALFLPIIRIVELLI